MEPRVRLLGNRYKLLVPLASGGMGRVWRARDTLLERPVAVKVLRSEFTGDATFRARFRAEAQHTAALHHPNIASVFDYGEIEEDGERLAYLVMELVEGENLSDLLERRGPAQPRAHARRPAADLLRAGRRARRRRDPSRRQAGQRARGQRRRRQDHRLRHRLVGVQRAPDRHRAGRRHGALPVTRAGRGRQGHAGQRRLRARHGGLRVPRRPAGVRRRELRAGGAQADPGGAAAAAARRAGRDSPAGRTGDGQGPGGAVPRRGGAACRRRRR